MPTIDQLLELFEGRDWEGYLPEEIVENVVNTVVEYLPFGGGMTWVNVGPSTIQEDI